ncbi:type II secretion system protein GspL [Roseateles sp. DB2]|uniref:type II secretion system protein GspL n=1 Tax=Roseateles sp. DB2 TaxID=3453717 RepID=UPI003EEFC560
MSSTLLILLPPRPRLGRAAHSDAPPRAGQGAEPMEFEFLLSADGRGVTAQGRARPAELPAASVCMAVVPDGELSWHLLKLPKAQRGKLQAALGGLLEEQLLEDPEQLHFAIAPQADEEGRSWVCVCHRSWLQGPLDALEQAGRMVERVLPLSWPGEAARAHVLDRQGDAEAQDHALSLVLSDARGVSTLPLDGPLARQLLGPGLAELAWTASPDAVQAAERWVGHPVSVQASGQRALQALQGPWNLRQFELVPRTRGLQALRQWGRQLMTPAWRPARLGLVGLVLVQVLALNVQAWQQKSRLREAQAVMSSLLMNSFPATRVVHDAPQQMRQAADALRARAGLIGERDFEALLSAAATAWPADMPPAEALKFEDGRLAFPATSWNPAQIDAFKRQLASEGWALDKQNGQLQISRQRSQASGG